MQRKILIFGNSGSGKSTLAKELQSSAGLAHLDLDVLAWEPSSPPERSPLEKSTQAIMAFIDANEGWIIEGCYADLLQLAAPAANELIFMNLPVDNCIANAKARPWEPHKYESKEAQDSNVSMLIDWIAQYPVRRDTFSQAAHIELYEEYKGNKRMYTSNERNV